MRSGGAGSGGRIRVCLLVLLFLGILLAPRIALAEKKATPFSPSASAAGDKTDDGARAESASEVEGDRDAVVVGPQAVPERGLGFADPTIASLASRVASGEASMQELRSWYMTSLLYSPFAALPPQNWRLRALEDGEAISIEARRRAAASRLGALSDLDRFVLTTSYTWTNVGAKNYNVRDGFDQPHSAQGRATALWVSPKDPSHPDAPNVLLAGFADGGLWKKVDDGEWVALTDKAPSLSIGSIAVRIRDPDFHDAIVYVGLGEGNMNADQADGGWVLKSVNGGDSFDAHQLVGFEQAPGSGRFHRAIRRIVIDPRSSDAGTVYAAADGGVYKSINGGVDWFLVPGLPYTGKDGDCWPEIATDFLVDPTLYPGDPVDQKVRLYAAFGAPYNGGSRDDNPSPNCTGVPGDPRFRRNNGIYRSVDGGMNWTQIFGGTAPGPVDPAEPNLKQMIGRITLLQGGACGDNMKKVYALVSCEDGVDVSGHVTPCPNERLSSLGIFSTDDATAGQVTWVRKATGANANFAGKQGSYGLTGAVDPHHPEKLLVGGVNAYYSVNAASDLVKVSDGNGPGFPYVHVDHHSIVFDGTSTTFYLASDGGVYKGTIDADNSISWENLNGGNLSTLQFYGISQSPKDPRSMHGGLQDNGEAYTFNSKSWSQGEHGDGGFSATDPTRSSRLAYEEGPYGAISCSTNRGQSYKCIVGIGDCHDCNGDCIPDGQTAFIAPLTLDANDGGILYTGSNRVYANPQARQCNSHTMNYWTPLGADLTAGDLFDHILHVHSAFNNRTTGTLWATTLAGKVWVTINATTENANWVNATRTNLPDRPATWVETDPADGLKAIVTYSGWNCPVVPPGQPGHVFRTLDGGGTWTDISGAPTPSCDDPRPDCDVGTCPLPDEPVFTIAVDPKDSNIVYIGTEFGVYVNTHAWVVDQDQASHWTRVNSGTLPNVHVHQLEFSPADNTILRAATHGRGIWELAVSACPALPAPTLAAPTLEDCSVKVSWTPGTPGAPDVFYNVYRSTGDCASGSFDLIATNVPGGSASQVVYYDTTAAVGITYTYKVTATRDDGTCESFASACETIAIPNDPLRSCCEGTCCDENVTERCCVTGRQGNWNSDNICNPDSGCYGECCHAVDGTLAATGSCTSGEDDDCSVKNGLGLGLAALEAGREVRTALAGNPLLDKDADAHAQPEEVDAVAAHVDAAGILQVTGGPGADLIVIRLGAGRPDTLEVLKGDEGGALLGAFDASRIVRVHVDGGGGPDALVLDAENGEVSGAARFTIEGTEIVLGSTGDLTAKQAADLLMPTLESAQKLLAASEELGQIAGTIAPLGDSGHNLITSQFGAADGSQEMIDTTTDILQNVHDGLVHPAAEALKKGKEGPITASGALMTDAYANVVRPAYCAVGAVCDTTPVTPVDFYLRKTFQIVDLAQQKQSAAQGLGNTAKAAKAACAACLGSDAGQGGAWLQEQLAILSGELQLVSDVCIDPLIAAPVVRRALPPEVAADGPNAGGSISPPPRPHPECPLIGQPGALNVGPVLASPATTPSASFPSSIPTHPPACIGPVDLQCCLHRTDISDCTERIDLIVSCMETLVDAFENASGLCETNLTTFADVTAEQFSQDAEGTLEGAGDALELDVDQSLEPAAEAFASRAEDFDGAAESYAASTEAILQSAASDLEGNTDALGQSGDAFATATEDDVSGLSDSLVSLSDSLAVQARTMIASVIAHLTAKSARARTVTKCGDISPTSFIYGTGAPDILVGLAGTDTSIVGGAGDDLLIGLDGNDRIHGGSGTDFLFGGPGVNELFGDDGVDLLVGGEEKDCMHGGDGVDVFFGLGGPDEMTGDNQIDLMLGNEGDDEIHGNSGIDVLLGGPGGNALYGGKCIDVLVGGNDDDRMYGGEGQTVEVGPVSLELGNLFIGRDGDDVEAYGDSDADSTIKGVDVMFGGPGDDDLSGGEGGLLKVGEKFQLELGNIMFGGPGTDSMRSDKGIDVMFGGPGDDTMCAGEGYTLDFDNGNFTLDLGDLLFGGPSAPGETDNDTLYGDRCPSDSDPTHPRAGHPEDFGAADHGIDVIFGGEGNDVIFGGHGGDLHTKNFDLKIGNLVFAGTGDDTVTDGDGIDLVFGGDGVDTLSAGQGADVHIDDIHMTLELGDFLFGGDGADTLYGDAASDSDGSKDDGIDFLFGGTDASIDWLYGGNGGDLTINDDFACKLGNVFFGGPGDDTLVAGYAAGGAEKGIDFMFAGDGNDTVDGQDGGYITIGAATDPDFKVNFGNLMFGGPGADGMTSGDGFDLMFGGPGNDVMSAGKGIDLMFAGDGDDTADGGDGGYVTVRIDGTPTRIPFGNLEFGGDGNDTVKSAGAAYEFPDPSFPTVAISLETDLLFGGCGNDWMYGGDGLIDLMFGQKGSDHMYGEEGIDLLVSGKGDDTLYGSCGPGVTTCNSNTPVVDLLFAGAGDDTLYGDCDPSVPECLSRFVIAPGPPLVRSHIGLLFGGKGNDTIHTGDDDAHHTSDTWFELLNVAFGGEGRDTIIGSATDWDGITIPDPLPVPLPVAPAVDVVFGGPDCDRIDGRGGVIDLLFGGPGDDAIFAGAGITEVAFGGDDRDIVSANCDPGFTHCRADLNVLNLLFGNKKEDVVIGGEGPPSINLLFGNADSDVLKGGGALDLEFGGPGSDTLLSGAGTEAGLSFGGEGADVLYGSDGPDAMFGGPGDDAIHGGGLFDLIFGGPDADTLSGDDGIDLIVGGRGDDTIDGGNGIDLVFGRAGVDRITGGGSSPDFVFGGPDADVVEGGGGDGKDYVFGGAGTDTLHGCDGDRLFNGKDGGNKDADCEDPTPSGSGFGVIAGTKWLDVDGDGGHDAPVDGVTIYLDDIPANGNGGKDLCEADTYTSGCGNYIFTGLLEGWHHVKEIELPGLKQEAPVESHAVHVTQADPLFLDRDFVNRDLCRPNADRTACDCSCASPQPVLAGRCTTDDSACAERSDCACGGDCVTRVVDCTCPAPAAGSHTVSGSVTCDNQFAVYTAAAEIPGMIVTYRGVTGCHPSAQPVSITTTDRYLYIAAWSDDQVAQGLLHDLVVDGTPAYSGSPRWTVAPTGADYDACYTDPPDAVATTMAAMIPTLSGRWTTPTVGCANPAPGDACDGVWGNMPSISLAARRTWYDSRNQQSSDPPFAHGYDHGEFLIFRLDMGCSCGPEGAPCDDGNPCTQGDLCHEGVCAGGVPLPCHDDDLCTTDACDRETAGCVYTPVECADLSACTADSCDPQTGRCLHVPSCDDHDVCTIDACDGQGGCTHVPGPPTEADNGVRFDRVGASFRLRWNLAPCASSSAVVRGRLSDLPVRATDSNQVCIVNGLPAGTLSLTDDTLPAPGAGFWYLVRGGNAIGQGPFGYVTVNGAPTVPYDIRTCP